jgi:hypothetical protein
VPLCFGHDQLSFLFANVGDEPSYWRMESKEALRYAKEIRDAEPVTDHPYLYAPLFKR